MPIFKTLEETYLNGDTLYNFGGYAPGILFPTPVPYNPPFCIGDGLAGLSAAGMGGNNINQDSDGNYYIVGQFAYYKDRLSPQIVKITSNGDVDETFSSLIPNPTTAYSLSKTKPSSYFPGKTYVMGIASSQVLGFPNSIARLNADGSYDNSFIDYYDFNVSGTIYDCVELSGGTLIIIGSFVSYDGVSRNRIAHIDYQGSIFPGFQGTGFPSSSNMPYQILLSPDEQYVYVCGLATLYNGISVNRVVKINSVSGDLITTFQPSLNQAVYNIAFDGAGNLWASGSFTDNGRNYITCLDAISGSPITAITTNIGVGFNNTISDMIYDPNTDRIICITNLSNAPTYNTYNGTTFYGRICAIDASTGLLDTTFGSTTDNTYGFDTSTIISNQINQNLFVDNNGNILVGGQFTRFNNDRYDKIIRLDQNGQSNTTTSC
jgi:hypothetical protein